MLVQHSLATIVCLLILLPRWCQSTTVAAEAEMFWKRIAINGPVPREGSASAYCPHQDSFFVFGPQPYNNNELFFWGYNFSQGKWSEVQDKVNFKVNTPTLLGASAMYLLSEGNENPNSPCRFLYVGPEQYASSKVAVGTWVVTVVADPFGSTWEKVLIDTQLDFPENRHHFASTFSANQLYIFGGQISSQDIILMNDLWRLSFTSNSTGTPTGSWEKLDDGTQGQSSTGSSGNLKPIAMINAAAAMLEETHDGNPVIALYGGETYKDKSVIVSNELWLFNLATKTWSQPALPSDQHRDFARTQHSLLSVGKHLVLFGGLFKAVEGGTFTAIVFDKALYTTIDTDPAIKSSPQTLCKSSGNRRLQGSVSVGLWCEDKFTKLTGENAEKGLSYEINTNITPYRRYGHTATVRRSNNMTSTQIIYYGGRGATDPLLSRSRDVSLSDLWILEISELFDASQSNMNIASERIHLEGQITLTPMLLFGMIFSLCVMFVGYHVFVNKVLRTRSVDMSELGDGDESGARGARLSLIKRLPLVAYETRTSLDEDTSSSAASVTDEGETNRENVSNKNNEFVASAEEDEKSGKQNTGTEHWQEDCAVCLLPFENQELLRHLPCGHEYHPDCVDQWLKANKSCPLCKTDIDEMALLYRGTGEVAPWAPITNDNEERAAMDAFFGTEHHDDAAAENVRPLSTNTEPDSGFNIETESEEVVRQSASAKLKLIGAEGKRRASAAKSSITSALSTARRTTSQKVSEAISGVRNTISNPE